MNGDRYIRQTSLKEFGAEAQKKLEDAKVLVVGAGGLGIPVLQYLNAVGVGTLGIVEQDVIETTNLHRQVLYYESEVGRPKIEVIHEKLIAQNSSTRVVTHDSFLVKENALEIIDAYDLVVDATDNFSSRYLINDACVILDKPVVYGALHGFEGQLSVFNYKGGATYRCLFPSIPGPDEIPDCNQQGVLGVIPGIIGNLQALEAVKVITGVGEVLSGKIMIYNGLDNSFYKISIPLDGINLQRTKLEDLYEINTCDPAAEISPDQLESILKSKQPSQLIDVRSTDEFQDYHLANSLHIPLPELEKRLDEVSRDIPVYLICQSGIRSLQALQLLLDRGHNKRVFHLSGGINRYKIHSS